VFVATVVFKFKAEKAMHKFQKGAMYSTECFLKEGPAFINIQGTGFVVYAMAA